MKIIYCSHPYLGDPEERADAERKVLALQARCPSVLWLSPLHAILRPYRHDDFVTDIRPCLALLKRCDGILMLDGARDSWNHSRGCLAELSFAVNKVRNNHHFEVILTEEELIAFIESER